MPGETIKITIERDGSTTIEGEGFAGGECKDLTKALEERLGEVQAVELKPEFHQHQHGRLNIGH